MSHLDITTSGSIVDDRWDYNEFEALTMEADIRIKADTDDVEEARIELRVSTRIDWNNITGVTAVASENDTVPSVQGRFNGGPVVTVSPGSDMSNFKLINDELQPVQDRGFGVNSEFKEYVSVANDGEAGWTTIDWTTGNLSPEVVITSLNNADVATNYTWEDCDGALDTAIAHDYKTEDDEDWYRVKLVTTQFYDARNISSISGLSSVLGRKQFASLPAVGYNNGASASLTAPKFLYPMVCTQVQIVPYDIDKGGVCRVKYRWETWEDWWWEGKA